MARHRGLSPADAFLASFPKSGNTWVKFMLGELLSGTATDFDTAEQLVPDVGAHHSAARLLPNQGRLIKTHEPHVGSWARAYKRSIYIVRDGRDVAVSYYFSMLRTGLFEGPFEDFLKEFLEGRVGGFGSWQDHVSSWVHQQGLCLLRYEDLLLDPVAGLAKATDFLGLDVSPETLETIAADNTADAMRSKEKGSRIDRERVRSDINFVRAAKSGGWQEHFDDRSSALFEQRAGDAMRLAGYDF